MNILDIIAENKHHEVYAARKRLSQDKLKDLVSDMTQPVRSLAGSITANGSSGIIAEFKRRSPSRGEISPMNDTAAIVNYYSISGAAGCSVLTDTRFFGGSLADLTLARDNTGIPLLRKDFIVKEYQIYEARLWGADAILLIASLLDADEIEKFTNVAHSLGLEVLLELHSPDEIQKVYPGVDMIGINNRDLTSFKTNLECSVRMFELISRFDAVKIAESGISTPYDMRRLRDVGFDGFLIGTAFMKTENPASTLKNFCDND